MTTALSVRHSLLIGLLFLSSPSVTLAAETEKAPITSAAINTSDIDAPAPEYNIIALQGLNKVTGHISTLNGPVGTVLRFGNLEIIPRRCWKSRPEERPENAALLEISELKPGEAPKQVFLGWMFSSSPGLSGLEHAVYDINIIACEAVDDPEKIEKQEPQNAPKAKAVPKVKKP